VSKNTLVRYHPLQVSLHWLTVVLIFAAFVLGKYTSGISNTEAGKLAPMGVHIALGIITLIVVVVRFVARMRLPKPASATTGVAFFDQIGKVVHYALYALMLLMAVSGVSLSMQAGLMPIVLSGSGASLPADLFIFTPRILHGLITPALVLLVLLHVGAALYHQFILKDNLLARMGYEK